MKKAILYNPPGGLWLRGEARCEEKLDDNDIFYTVTEPLLLEYIAAIFLENNIETLIIDCPVNKVTVNELCEEISRIQPDIIIANGSYLNLDQDLAVIEKINNSVKVPNLIHGMILPGLKYESSYKNNYKKFSIIDFFIIDEAEAVAFELVKYLKNRLSLKKIRGLLVNDISQHMFIKTTAINGLKNLDVLPLPARYLVDNKYYVRPDVNRPMASIMDSKGCVSSCVFCLAPITNGKIVRKRKVDSIIDEITECIEKYNIRDFLFRSDNFTYSRSWLIDFCDKIIEKKINISWAANSRVDTFDEEIAFRMKRAGCFLIEFGIESGAKETLRKINKKITIQQIKDAITIAKKAKILTMGTILIGFPWEKKEHLFQTELLVKKINLDFIDISIISPFPGTAIYDFFLSRKLLEEDHSVFDHTNNPAIKGTLYLNKKELVRFRKNLLKKFYLNYRFIIKTVLRINNVKSLCQYMKYAMKLIIGLLSVPNS